MNCRNARKLMDAVLDGDKTHQARLESHLAECERCRAQWAMFRRAQEALVQCARRPVQDSALERLTDGVLSEVGALSSHHVAPAPRRWVAFAVAASLLLAFGAGLGAGRTLWPRALTVTKVVTEREVVEKPVEVPVRVVEERVVVKPVPVVKTRIVYRDRLVSYEGAAESELVPAVREVSEQPEVEFVGVNPVVRREIQLAAVAQQPAGEDEPRQPPVAEQANADADGGPKTIMVAQTGLGTIKTGQGEDQ